MGENSSIEWTHHSFNPWIGCTKVSAACDNCYAEAWDSRFKGDRWGSHAPRTRTKDWSGPRRWNKKAEASGQRLRVFCASLADVFDNHKSILPEWRRDLWQLIKETPHLDWLLLTKRPQNIRKYLPDDWTFGFSYPNVWLGVTTENQLTADQRIPTLLGIPCAMRFISAEPLLGSIDLTYLDDGLHNDLHLHFDALTGTAHDGHDSIDGIFDNPNPKIDWVITGGENSTNYREMNIDWVRFLRDQCSDYGTPFLFKQWAGKNRKDIQSKGRLLDGVVHDGYPEAGKD